MVQLALISSIVMQAASIAAAGAAEQQALLQFGVRQSSAINDGLVIEGKPEETRHRRTKLQTMLTSGENMEKEYREMALAAMDCPEPPCAKPTMPEKDTLEKLFEQFDNLITELVNVSQPCNQDMVDHANSEVLDCNQNMTSSFEEKVNVLMGVTQDARDNHQTCRKKENMEWKSRAIGCQAFDAAAKECHSYEWFASQETGVGSHAQVVTTAVDCSNKTQQAEKTSPSCARSQATFESRFCVYSATLRSVCGTHSKCYDGAIAARLNTVTEVKEEVEAQKNIYFSVLKARCFVNLLDGPGRSGHVTQSDVDSCMSLEVDVDTSALDVDYVPAVGERICDTSPAQWNFDEYAKLPVDHVCTASAVCKVADPLACVSDL